MVPQIFEMKQEGWEVSIRYFQNIVNDVRDLLSPIGEERHYKQGLHRDESGFMEFDWVSESTVAERGSARWWKTDRLLPKNCFLFPFSPLLPLWLKVSSVPLESFDAMCQAVREANRRKAIAATQFNWQSTRGHCILQVRGERPPPGYSSESLTCWTLLSLKSRSLMIK